MLFGKKKSNKSSFSIRPSVKQRFTFRQIVLVSTLSVGVVFGLVAFYNLANSEESKAATTTEVMSTGSFIVNMGITPQTEANGLMPYGLLYDLIMNYQVPIKWVIESTKVKDGIDFTYNSTDYKGGPFIIPVEYIDSTITSRITYWQSLGVQGEYTTSSLSVPVYMTVTNYPLIMIDTIAGNQSIIANYYSNAGIPSTAYTLGAPSGLTTCHDMWVNPHGDPTWSTHSSLYNFVRNQKGYIWSQCHAVSNLEGTENTVSPYERLNYLTTNGLKCWKLTGTGAAYCGRSITQTHVKNPSSPYTCFYPSDPVAQFMGGMSGACLNGSEQWFQPQSTGQWRPTTLRLVTTGTGTSPGEGVMMVYGPAYGDNSFGKVMYNGGHNIDSSGTTAERVAGQRAFFNYMLLAGKDKQLLFSNSYIPTSFTGGQTIDLSVTITSGIPQYTYQWTSTVPGTFSDATTAYTTFTAADSETSFTGIIRCVVTDACGRKNFISQIVSISPGVLPISLTRFTAEIANNKTVVLNWETASEQNNDFFTIERSQNGQHYSSLAKVKGAGNSTASQTYTHTDENPLNGTSYYRLKQTDYDGRSETFRAIPVKLNKLTGAITDISISPNPFDENFTAQFTSDSQKEVTIEFLTVRSKVIRTEKLMLKEGTNTYHFNGGNALHPGLHVLRILDGGTLLASAKALKQ
jgi:hypothetical protein